MTTPPTCLFAPFRGHGRWLVCLVGLLWAAAARADDVLPRPADPKRYEKLSEHSPFAPPSAGPMVAPVATPPPGPSWSDNLVVTSLMQIGNVYTATVMEKDTSLTYLVSSVGENPDHQLAVSSVHWANTPDQISVTMRKGAQFGDVRFDPSATPGGTAAPGVPPPPVGRVQPPGPVAAFHPPPLPGQPLNQPGPRQPGNNFLRARQPIRANPGPPQPPHPIINRSVGPRHPVAPTRPGKDDDDDDD